MTQEIPPKLLPTWLATNSCSSWRPVEKHPKSQRQVKRVNVVGEAQRGVGMLHFVRPR